MSDRTEEIVISQNNSTSLNTVNMMMQPTTAITMGAAGTTFSNVTVTIQNEDTEEATDLSWEAVLAIEGMDTSDKRYLIPDEITERELPQTLMVQTVNEEGHKGSEVGGRIDEIWRVSPESARAAGYALDGVPDDAIVIMGNGVFDNSEEGRNYARMVREEMLRGVSIDLAPTEVIPLDPKTHEPIDTSKMDIFELLTMDFITGIKGAIMGATVVPFAAFEQASIRMTASAALPHGGSSMTFTNFYGVKLTNAVTLVASAGPLKPPIAWFEDPKLSGLTPLTITKEGRIYGHLADWSGCHTSYTGICVPPPRSASNYAYFNVGEIETDDGSLINVGKLMFSREGGQHAPTDEWLTVEDVMRHYDDATCVGGFVRAGSDRYGTWIAGVLRHDLSDEDIQHLRAHPPSGDWRPVKHTTELVAAFCVPVPGFPIPRAAEAHLVASAGEVKVTALITPPVTAELAGYRKRKRKKYMLGDRLKELLAAKPA